MAALMERSTVLSIRKVVRTSDCLATSLCGACELGPLGCEHPPVERCCWPSAISHQGPQRLYAILPANLLAFQNAPRIVGDGHFRNRETQPSSLGRNFRAEFKPYAFEFDRVNYFARERFVGGRFVGKMR